MKEKNPESGHGWVVQVTAWLCCLSLPSRFLVFFLIDFEVVVFCFLKKWKRMNCVNTTILTLKNLLPF